MLEGFFIAVSEPRAIAKQINSINDHHMTGTTALFLVVSERCPRHSPASSGFFWVDREQMRTGASDRLQFPETNNPQRSHGSNGQKKVMPQMSFMFLFSSQNEQVLQMSCHRIPPPPLQVDVCGPMSHRRRWDFLSPRGENGDGSYQLHPVIWIMQ